MKVINMSNRSYKTMLDAEFPMSREATLEWLGFSDEGLLLSFDSAGVIRAFNFAN
jgi:alpha-D-ribose 1-methylphosphonate 5-triphosphate synthase subunit PhnI